MASLIRAIWLTRHGDVRVVWRVFLFVFSASAIAALLVVGLSYTAFLPGNRLALVMLLAALSATAIMTRLVNRKPFGAAGLARTRGATRDFALGCLLGLLMMGGIFLIELGLGFADLEWYRPGPLDGFRVVVISALLFAISALGEEVMFRGYAFQSMMQGMTFLPAALGVSVLFALAHLGNPEISFLAMVNIGLAGVWLSFAYLKTRTLWLPFGLHFSWNFCQTTLFSFPTSGLRMEDQALFSLHQGGPDWVTGGGFGPEGGVLATIAIVLCTWHLLKSSLYRREEGVITLDSIEDLMPTGGPEEKTP